MKNILKKHGSLFVWVFLLGAFLLPGSNLASAGGYQFLAPIPTNPNTGFTDLSDYMKYLYVAIVGLAIVLGVVMIVIGGVQYVTAAVPSAKEDGKKRVGGAIIGVLLALISYVAIEAINPKLDYVGLFFPQGYNPPGGGGGGGGGIYGGGGGNCNNDGTCGTGETNANCANDCPAVCGNNVCEQGETKANCPNDCKTSGSGGSCEIMTSGYCTPDYLRKYFGDRAEDASRICHMESGGNPNSKSQSDCCRGASCLSSRRGCDSAGIPSISMGLFQINLNQGGTQHLPGFPSRDCREAFSGGLNCGCTGIKDQALYNQCVAAATNPEINLAAAKYLFDRAGGFGPWSYSRSRCHVR